MAQAPLALWGSLLDFSSTLTHHKLCFASPQSWLQPVAFVQQWPFPSSVAVPPTPNSQADSHAQVVPPLQWIWCCWIQKKTRRAASLQFQVPPLSSRAILVSPSNLLAARSQRAPCIRPVAQRMPLTTAPSHASSHSEDSLVSPNPQNVQQMQFAVVSRLLALKNCRCPWLPSRLPSLLFSSAGMTTSNDCHCLWRWWGYANVRAACRSDMSQHLLSGQYLAHTSQSGLFVLLVLADSACFSALTHWWF